MSDVVFPLNVESPCPVCGYDLRGGVSRRCPECGNEITEQLLRAPTLPWAVRRELGTSAAFFKTLRLVLRRPWKLWSEAVREVDDRAALAFQRLCMFPTALLAAGSVAFLSSSYFSTSRFIAYDFIFSLSGAVDDIMFPLGQFYPCASCGLAAGVAAYLLLTGIQTPFALLRSEGKVTERALRAAALSRYTSSFLLAGVGCLLILVNIWFGTKGRIPFHLGLVSCVCVLGALWSLVLFVITPFILLKRAGAGFGTLLLAGLIYTVQALLVLLGAAFAVGWLPAYLVYCARILLD